MPTPSANAILRTAELRALEARHAGVPLMARAGAAAADVANALVERRAPVVVLCGPGNNGGDGFVVARHLRERFFDVVAVFRGDAARLPADARAAHAAYVGHGGMLAAAPPPGAMALVIDGLFGIGLARPVSDEYAQLIEWANGVVAPRLALDVPSGIDADTGTVHGIAVDATHTATFLAWKPGLLTGDGPDRAGTVSVHDLGVDAAPDARGVRLDWAALAARLPPVLQRARRGVHKGTFGTLCIVGGGEGMVGAALLAGRGALACGPGKVHVRLLAADGPVVDAAAPELMLRRSAEPVRDATAWVVGPGLSTTAAARAVLAECIGGHVPLVLDADALNLLAVDEALRTALRARANATILTPHPAEAARLLGCDTGAVQRDRVGAAVTLAQSLCAHVVVKGAGSVIADPRGTFAINATGNPALATGGSGDILAGMLGALLAQGIEAATALRLGVCVHGAAADALVAAGEGPVGLRASELPAAVRRLLNRVTVTTSPGDSA